MRFFLTLSYLAGLTLAHAFMPNPDLLMIAPAVGKAGATVEVTIKGSNLDEATTLRFADPRFQVETITQSADEFHPEPRPVANRFKITIPADAEPGLYEVRSLGYFGLSTARPFMVVDQNAVETREEGNHSTRETAMPLELETGVLGTTDNRKIDWYRFTGKGGERLIIQAWAERLDSRADCQLAVFDEAGRELDSNRRSIGADPLVDFTPPTDGEYFVALSETLYRGNSEYFYRLQISRQPRVDFAFPPAVEPGKTAKLTQFGRHLPDGKIDTGNLLDGKPIETATIKVSAPAEVASPAGIQTAKPRVAAFPGFIAGSTKVGFATAPVVLEDADAIDQLVTVPCEIAGRFDEPGDIDSFRFTAEKDRTYALEVYSDRLGVLSDPVISVRKVGDDGKLLAEADDPASFYGPDSLDDLNANTLDPALQFTAPEAGDYLITLLNQSGGGSLAHLYRLAIRDPQPDFQLIAGTERTKTINNDAYPAAPLLRRGGAMVFRILALRQDGFEGDITVEAHDLPEGVIAPPLVMSGKTTEGYLMLQARADAPRWTGPIRITGTADINENAVTREARNGSIIWGIRVFGNQRQVRSRIDEEIVLSVMDTEAEPTILAPAEDKVWTAELNQTLDIPFTVHDAGPRKGSLQVEVFGFPGMLRSPPKTSIAEGATEGKVTINFRPSGNFKIEPGRYQFVLQGVGNALYRHNPAAAERAEAEVARLTDLAKTVAGDEAKAKTVATLKTAAEKAAKQSADTAKEKTQQFATYSVPITVEVTAPAPKK
tara:strand:+ start:792 stop:3113 length:2322 start_codon:yes stop_codon:yes gene_type:complete